MKISRSILICGVFITRLYALESAEISAVAKRFDSPSGDEQYQARIELNRLVAQATLPGKGDPAAVTKMLISALQSPDTSKEAAKYLVRAMSRVATADAIAPLAKLLEGQDPMLKEESREALSWIRDPQAVAVLEASLKTSSDKRERLGLIEALASQKSVSSVAVLSPFVVDADADLARASTAAIARIGGAPAVAALTSAHAGNKLAPGLKPEVETALLVAGSGDAKTATAVYQSAESGPVKLAAFIALMNRAPDSAKAELIEGVLKSEDSDLRHAALARGIAINLPALQSSLAQSLEKMPKEDRMIVLANIHLLKPADAAEKIALSRIASAEEDERISAITALGRIDSKPAFDAVLQAVGAREPRVNQAASNALAGMTCLAAEPTLLAMLKGDSSPDKVLAIKAMVSRQVKGGNAVLLEIVKGADQTASKEAMKTLFFTASIDDLRSLSAAAAATPDAELRRSLISICSRIATRINTAEALELVKDLK